VLTCRGPEYEKAVQEGDVLRTAGVIELCALDRDDLHVYLEETTRYDRTDKWAHVFMELDEHPEGPLATALKTPLMAWLCGTIYGKEESDPSQLLARDSKGNLKFGSTKAVEGHLLDELIPTVFDSAREKERSPRGWTGQKAKRWLTFLAVHLHRLGTRDLAWWYLYRAIPRPALGVAFSFVLVPAFGLAAGLVAGLGAGILFGLLVGLAGGFAVGLVGPSGPSDVESQSRLVTESFAHKFGRATVFGLAVWLAAGLASMLVFGLATGLWVWLVGAFVGICAGGANILLSKWFDLRASRMPVAEPLAVLRLARVSTLASALTYGLATLSAGVLSAGLEVGVAAALSVGLSIFFVNAWGGFAISRACLAVSGRLPWRLTSFLDEAHQDDVLRQPTDVYQFHHARLQDRLVRRWYEKAAAAGHTDAMYKLAVLLAEPDPTAARGWYEKAAAAHTGVMANLGELLAEIQGPPAAVREGRRRPHRRDGQPRAAAGG